MATSSSLDSAPIDPGVRAFFHTIKENPDDDTPRLIFADWLQERDNASYAARGEFLRLNVMRHRLSPDNPTYDLLKRREGELFTEHRWTWLGPLVDAAKSWKFERGMIQITAQAEKLITPEMRAWAQTPAALWIDSLKLRDFLLLPHVDKLDELAKSPLLAEINCLDLRAGRHPEAIYILEHAARAQSLRFLTNLCLARCRLRRLHGLARSIELPSLKILDLQHNSLDDSVARSLAESPNLKNVAELRLGHNRFTVEGVALLRQAFGDRVHF
jgi:uncharacterized protein (TIGR02996 family)